MSSFVLINNTIIKHVHLDVLNNLMSLNSNQGLTGENQMPIIIIIPTSLHKGIDKMLSIKSIYLIENKPHITRCLHFCILVFKVKWLFNGWSTHLEVHTHLSSPLESTRKYKKNVPFLTAYTLSLCFNISMTDFGLSRLPSATTLTLRALLRERNPVDMIK